MILKFFMGDSYNAVSCNHYHVTKLKSGVIEVTLYPKYTTTDGVTYRLSESEIDEPYFDSCTVHDDLGRIFEVIC
ncbi:hypothetical protein [Vibrio phage P23]|nr:hypothetical protein [Vibrio phage P23]